MSWDATSWAMRTRVGDATLKLLLLTLANYANDQCETWHSREKISFDSEMSIRTISRKLQQLMELGLIQLIQRRREDGAAMTTLIRLLMPSANLADGQQRTTVDEAKPSANKVADGSNGHHRPKRGGTIGQIKAPPSANKVADHNLKLLKENNLLGESEPPDKPKKIKTTIPDSFAITDEHLRFARERGFEAEQARFMFDKFKSHHQSKGSLMLRWDAAWRTWVLNQVGFAKKDGWRSPNDRGNPII